MTYRSHGISSFRFLIGIGLAVASVACFSAGGEMKSPSARETSKSFAVVELFTSEGCSSCPPADAVLSDIVSESRRDGLRVYPIAFHVDYWNRLGWRDPFSRPEASARQSDYARSMRADGVYTPQMIVNGKAEFIGSDKRRAATEIRSALNRPAAVGVSLQIQRTSKTDVKVDYTVDAAPAGTVLNVVAVERGLVTKVMRGENGGRTLQHENVARTFETTLIPATGKGRSSLSLPADVNPEKMSIIAFVQNPQSMEILGAQGVDLPTVVSQ